MTPQKIAAVVKRVIRRSTGAKIGHIRYAHSLNGIYALDTAGDRTLRRR